MNVSNNTGTSLNLNVLFKFICLNMDDNQTHPTLESAESGGCLSCRAVTQITISNFTPPMTL